MFVLQISNYQWKFEQSDATAANEKSVDIHELKLLQTQVKSNANVKEYMEDGHCMPVHTRNSKSAK